jgi:tetratricopeptide (TPR) repeat protein
MKSLIDHSLRAFFIGKLFLLSCSLQGNTQSLSIWEQLDMAIDSGLIEQASAQFRQIPKNENNQTEWLTYQAIIQCKSGHYKQARKTIDSAEKIAPDNAEIHYRKGEIYGELARNSNFFSALKYARRSLNSFLKAVELDPENIHYIRALIFYLIQAPGAAGGDKDEAIQWAKKLGTLSPIDSFLMELEVYYSTGDLDAQSDLIDRAAIAMPDEAEVYVRRGYIHEVNGKLDLAIADMERAIVLYGKSQRKDDGYFNALFQSSRILNKAGQQPERQMERLNFLLRNLHLPKHEGLLKAVKEVIEKHDHEQSKQNRG